MEKVRGIVFEFISIGLRKNNIFDAQGGIAVLDWRKIVENARNIEGLKTGLRNQKVPGVYEESLQEVEGSLLFLVKEELDKFLVIVGDNLATDAFEGKVFTIGAYSVKKAPLSAHNAQVLRRLFTWTAPQPFGSSGVSMGLGDRLGLASPGHLKAIKNTKVRPVLAQQSMRELQLTNRTYQDVLDAASWAVFQTGYEGGFGADGDHLKKIEDIKVALELGFSMITLDCSEHIDDGIAKLGTDEVLERYALLPQGFRSEYEELYKKRTHYLENGTAIEIGEDHYYRMILTYHPALNFMEQVYKDVISQLDRVLDFEISIDEVGTPTTPQDHFFVANELARRGIKISGIAPRFCGSFEKGIDYVGDLEQFEQEFVVHGEIAEHFGYKLSIHSGSDKFSVFPIIGKYVGERCHVKTAGTNWLEAVRVIATVDPTLYRKLHVTALDSLEEAKNYYQVSLDVDKIPQLDELSDGELPDLLNQDDARQLLHITYGFMLQDPVLKESIYRTLAEHETMYEDFLSTHLRRHLEPLNFA